MSAYLQVAALQAEYPCRLTGAYSPGKATKTKRKDLNPLSDQFYARKIEKEKDCRKLSLSEIEKRLKKILRFKVTPRTLIYIEKRLGDINSEDKRHKTLQKLISKDRLLEFKTVFKEILNRNPFVNAKERNIDIMNALNFTIFDEVQGKRIAQECLLSVTRWRNINTTC